MMRRRSNTAFVFFLLISFILPASLHAASSAPVEKSGAQTYARSDGEFARAIVIDVASGAVLYEYQADKAWPAASLTKLMGALVFLDQKPKLGATVKMTKADEVGGGRLRVASGATMTVRDLVYSSITASANNAATALARISGLGVKGFVNAMNTKATVLGLEKTTFVDPSGIDPRNVTTAREMAKIAMTAFNIETIRRPASTVTYRFVVRNIGERKTLTNTNDLLFHKDYDDLYVTGGKTGFLYESRYNLTVRMKPMGAKGTERLLMIVVFGSPTRDGSFKSTKSLANWAWAAHQW